MTVDAYMIDDGERLILHRSELPGLICLLVDEAGGYPVEVTPLTLLWSLDHGLRCADETIGEEVCRLAHLIVEPLMVLFGIDARYATDAWKEIGPEIGAPLWMGGWIGDEHIVDGADPQGVAEALYDLCDQVRSQAGEVGLIVETDGDCGMTWCYVPAH